jgi:renalase
VVFERTATPGGRVATRTVPNIELPTRGTVDLSFDHGAQYFTVRDPRFSEVVAYWLRDRVASKSPARIVVFDGEGWEPVEDGTDRYVGTPGMNAIAAHMARGLDIQYGARIDSLDGLNNFERVVIAVPSDQAVPLLGESPDLLSRVAAVKMQPCWAVMAAFEDRVSSRFDAAFVTSSPLGWVKRHQGNPRDPIDTWVLHATSAWSRAHLDDRADVVAPFLLEAFDDLVRGGLPRVFHFAAHRWKYAIADPGLSVGALRDESGRITVCGDWCVGSRIEDAYLSGLAACKSVRP